MTEASCTVRLPSSPEPVEARHDDALRWCRARSTSAIALDHAIAAVVPAKHAEVEQGLGHLLDEERDALRLLHERPQHLRRQARDAEHLAGQSPATSASERLWQRQRRVVAAARRTAARSPAGRCRISRMRYAGARRRSASARYSSVLLSIQCRSSNTSTSGRSCAPRSGQRAHRLEDPRRAAAAAAIVGHRGVARVHREQVADVRDVGVQLAHAPHAVLDLGDDLRLAVDLLDREVLRSWSTSGRNGIDWPNDTHWPSSHVTSSPASPSSRRNSSSSRDLPMPASPDDEHHLARGPALTWSKSSRERGELALAADERRQPALGRDVADGSRAAARAQDLERADRARAPSPRARRGRAVSK